MAKGEKAGTQKAHRPKNWGNILIAIGLLLVAAALSLTVYNYWDDARAAQASTEIVNQLDEQADVPADETPTGDDEQGVSADAQMPTKTVDGYEYIGELSIPALGVRLPVMAEWDYTRLRVSPCRYTGSYLTEDLVICGHNYPSHFRGLLSIDIGADVYLQTVAGESIHYVVANREIVQPTSIEQMVENDRNSDSSYDWDLTLFTCTLGGQTRCAARCVRE